MPKIITYTFVKKQFEKENFLLLSKNYINAHQNLEYLCSQGHAHRITWNNWKKGRRCPYCATDAKLSTDFVANSFVQEGYKLLTSVYINNRQKLEYICPNGHRHSISWGSWNKGSRCKYCDKRKTSLDVIKEAFELEDYNLLSTNYINSKTKLKYKCPRGHIGFINWDNWHNLGQRCGSCANIERTGPGHPNWKGGISCEPYCDAWADKEYKESIKERDAYKCQNPDCWGTSNRLTIHHIDYDKKNCSPDNLITLCNSCNSRANRNRCWHMLFYNNIMTNNESMVDI